MVAAQQVTRQIGSMKDSEEWNRVISGAKGGAIRRYGAKGEVNKPCDVRAELPSRSNCNKTSYSQLF
eukprot:1313118-Pleurochrysis_carterae.AAC.2